MRQIVANPCGELGFRTPTGRGGGGHTRARFWGFEGQFVLRSGRERRQDAGCSVPTSSHQRVREWEPHHWPKAQADLDFSCRFPQSPPVPTGFSASLS